MANIKFFVLAKIGDRTMRFAIASLHLMKEVRDGTYNAGQTNNNDNEGTACANRCVLEYAMHVHAARDTYHARACRRMHATHMDTNRHACKQ